MGSIGRGTFEATVEVNAETVDPVPGRGAVVIVDGTYTTLLIVEAALTRGGGFHHRKNISIASARLLLMVFLCLVGLKVCCQSRLGAGFIHVLCGIQNTYTSFEVTKKNYERLKLVQESVRQVTAGI